MTHDDTSTVADSHAVFHHPHVAFGREVCGDLQASLRREWLVTNGIGGYASATLSGVLSRSYHGLLVAALEPPTERTVLVAGSVDWATYRGTRYPLSTHEFEGETFVPDGARHLESFHLEGALPVWTYALGDARIERRLWMVDGTNMTFVTYRLLSASAPLQIESTPLVTYRSFHALTSGAGWKIGTVPTQNGVEIQAFDGAVPFWLRSDRAMFTSGGAWWWNFHHRSEQERGLPATGDLFAPGTFEATLACEDQVAFVYSTDPDTSSDATSSLAMAQQRQRALLERANATNADAMTRQLVLAADQFLVRRPLPEDPDGKTVIAGYHWFNDWGRDTMISLPGLTLATGRPEIARSIIQTFSRFVDNGLLPNNFPDRSGVAPGYNTADATLWYILAIRAYDTTTGDPSLATALLPTMIAIIDHHLAGTRFGIGVDPDDNLLRAGEPGVQLTWMDAKVGDWVVTPRIGKPVELNALWYNALRSVASLAADRGDHENATRFEDHAMRTKVSFLTRFRHPDRSQLADVIDGPEGDDWSVRPNQIFAVSLPFSLVDDEDARSILHTAGAALATSYGLRSLDPADHAYRGTYSGPPLARDGSYHQGPAWSWLLGPYAEALARIDRADAARAALAPIADHLRDAGLGSISEIFEGDPPHLAKGCIAQAWGVAEILRVWRTLAEPGLQVSRESPKRTSVVDR